MAVTALTSFGAVRLLSIAALLVTSACTGGGEASDGAGGASSSRAGASVTAEGGSPPAGRDAAVPGDGTGAGSSTGGVAATLPPPRVTAVVPADDEALAAMPGLYGLALLRTEIFDDRIDIASGEDCAAVADILQSGQWALQFAPRAEGDASEVDAAHTRLGTLQLGDATAEVRLVESAGSCSGSIALPAGGP